MIKLARNLPVVFMVFGGVTLSVWGFQSVRDLELARAEAEFSRAASERIAVVQRQIDADLEILHAINAFYASSKFVDRDEFRSFVSPAIERQGSIQALEWVPSVKQSDRSTFEKNARDDGFSDFRITERDENGRIVSAAPRAEYFPGYYVEPHAGNERAFGFDLASNPARRAALQAAGDSGQPIASAPITLLQGSGNQRGFLAFAPSYARGQPVGTVPERRASLAGFALGVFRIGDIVNAAMPGLGAVGAAAASDMDLYFYDTEAPAEERRFYVHSARERLEAAPPLTEAAARSSTHFAQSLEVAGRTWNVVARPAASVMGAIGTWSAWGTIAGGLAFTTLLSAYLVISLNRTRAIEHLAQARTVELRAANDELQREAAERQAVAGALHEKEKMYRDLVSGSIQGILIHREWKPLFANQAYADILGYESPEEVVAMGSIAEQHASHEHDRMQTLLGAGECGGELQAQFEYEAVRKDGTTVTLLNSGRLVEWNGEKATQRTVIDVTERKRAEERFRQVVEFAPAAMVMVNEAGAIVLINAETEALFGYTRDELLGRPLETLVPERFRAAHPVKRESFFKAPCSRPMGSNRDLYGLRKDGTEFPVEIALNPIETDEGMVVLSAITDITSRKKIDKMKNEFISTVSHELRTPLTSIMGSLGLIRSGTVGEIPEAAASMIQIAYQNSDRLVRLINDILDIEKIESGKLDFRLEPLEVDDLVRDAVNANTGFAGQADVRFVVNDSLPNVWIRGDQDRLMQVFTNLLSNAVKFSPAGSEVAIGLSHSMERVRFSVTDQGPGIPENFRNKIFGKFAQADSSDTRRIGGTGLGLSIAKAIVERLGGTIGFETELGEGTSFYFELPGHIGERRVVAEQMSSSSSNHRVLVCEDDPDVASLIGLLLEREGYLADVASTANEAFQMSTERHYDAMTLDICLPGESGIELIKRLRQQEQTRTLPIIVVSAVATEREGELAGDAFGVVDWLNKPIDQPRLLEGIRQAARAADNPRARVLHVEDEEDVQKVVGAVVEPYADVTRAGSLRDARALLERNAYDLILLDLGLPDGSGEQLITEIKDSPHANTPVIIFSARDVSSDVGDAVAETLVKSRTTNEALAETITGLIRTFNTTEGTLETAA